MAKAIQFTEGERIPNTRLCYMAEADRVDPKRRRAHFKCDCGESITTDLNWVRFLNITSCGCFKSELVTEKNTKHSHAVRNQMSGAYRSWQALQQRAGTKKNYEHVGVCPQWTGEGGFEQFLKDMGDRPDGHTIERLDNSIGYEPGNCKWATPLEQAQNTSQTTQVTIDGITHSINEWCRIKGIGYHLIKQRRKRGMTVEQSITTPVNPTKQGRKIK